MNKLTYLLLLLICMVKPILANEKLVEEELTEEKANTDALRYVGVSDVDVELYRVDASRHFVQYQMTYQPLINEKHVVNVEFGVVQASLPQGKYVSPADTKLAYKYNFRYDRAPEGGYQGSFTGIQLTLPTGRNAYLSGFDNWTLEPTIGSHWEFSKHQLNAGYRVRYNHSFATLPQAPLRFSYLRVEAYLGYENDHIWFVLKPGYRYIPSQKEHNLFAHVSTGYKLNENFGIKLSYKPRVIGTSFFASQASTGVYLYF